MTLPMVTLGKRGLLWVKDRGSKILSLERPKRPRVDESGTTRDEEGTERSIVKIEDDCPVGSRHVVSYLLLKL